MPSRTVSVTSNGVTSNVTIPDRDAVAGVKNYDVNGQSVTVNRTAPVIDSDRAGESRPLLSKVVGGATAAFSLRDLKDKQGNNKVIRVRREKDSEEKDFLAKDVPNVADFVNGLQETTLPADLPPTSSSITGFTFSGTNDPELSGTYTTDGTLVNGKFLFVKTGDNSTQVRYNGSKWLIWNNYEEEAYYLDVGNADFPWDVQVWEVEAGNGGTPVFSNFVGGNPDNSPDVAFSLRKVNSSYTGHAVRIRRTSDNVEVNVSFDTNDKVSTSSAITDVTESPDRGDTTATTLGEFLTQNINKLDLKPATSGLAGNVSNETTTGFDFSVNNEGSTGFKNLLLPSNTTAGTYVATFDVTLNSGSLTGVSFRSGSPEDFTDLVVGSNSITITPNNNSNVYFRTSSGAVANVSITNITFTQTFSAAAVHTWYDQSGNARHAAQSQSARQPLIADEAGTYLEELKFDGTNDSLATNQGAGVQVSNTESFALFGVVNVPNDEMGYLFGTARNTFYTGSSLWVYQNYIFLTDGNTPREYIVRSSEEILVSTCYTSNEANLRVNGGGTSLGDSTYLFAANGNFTIGSIETGRNSSIFLDGSIKEIIGYASDQTANRFKIESNINNYYGIYPTNGGNGFVSRWYDQSGFNHHASQGNSATQPKIVTNGNLVVDGTGRTAISGTGGKLTFAPNKPVFSSDGTHSLFLVGDFNDQRGGADNFADVVGFTPLTQSGAANRKPRIHLKQADGKMVISNPSFNLVSGEPNAFITLSDTLAANLISTIGNPNLSTANHVVHINGVQKLSSNDHTIINTQTLTAGNASLFDQSETTVEHFLTEVIYYPSDQRLNRPAIEANIANQWGITLP